MKLNALPNLKNERFRFALISSVKKNHSEIKF